MLVYALILFAVAALIGLIMAASVLRGRLAPWFLSLLHLVLGASGLFLVYQTFAGGEERIMTAFALLVTAAVLGLYLALQHVRGVVASKAVVFLHFLLGAAGVGLLGTMVYIHNLTF